MPQDFDGKITQYDLNFIITKLNNLYNTYRWPNVTEEIDPSYQPPTGVSVDDEIVIGDLTAIHTHYRTKIGNLSNPDLGMPSQGDIILDDPFESLYNAIEYINFIQQQPCYACDDYGCYCDGTCYSYDSCTCDFTCDSGFTCDGYDNCTGHTCGCYDMCYGSYVPPPESGECTCNFGCDSVSPCLCDFTCYILYSCSCDSQCDGDSCPCDFGGYYSCNQCHVSNYACTASY